MSFKKSFILSSPSGAGKNTLINKLLLDPSISLSHSISTTTRLQREYEKDGEHYYFITQKEFEQLIEQKQFLEWEKVYNNYYGTSIREIERILNLNKYPILDLDIKGALNIKKKFPEVHTIFIMPPSIEELNIRLKKRSTETEEEIQKRLESAEYEISFKDKYDYIIINNDIEVAYNELRSLIINLCK